MDWKKKKIEPATGAIIAFGALIVVLMLLQGVVWLIRYFHEKPAVPGASSVSSSSAAPAVPKPHNQLGMFHLPRLAPVNPWQILRQWLGGLSFSQTTVLRLSELTFPICGVHATGCAAGPHAPPGGIHFNSSA